MLLSFEYLLLRPFRAQRGPRVRRVRKGRRVLRATPERTALQVCVFVYMYIHISYIYIKYTSGAHEKP